MVCGPFDPTHYSGLIKVIKIEICVHVSDVKASCFRYIDNTLVGEGAGILYEFHHVIL